MLAIPRPQEGGLRRGEKFWLRLTTASAQCLRLSERFFHLHLVLFLHVVIVCVVAFIKFILLRMEIIIMKKALREITIYTAPQLASAQCNNNEKCAQGDANTARWL